MAEYEEEVHNSHPHADSSPPPPPADATHDDLTDSESHATRHARRVYVGDLPPTANEQSVATFFNEVMAKIGGNTAGPGDAVVNVCINHDKKFAFLEMRSVEEASNAMALDRIIFEGAPVKVRRPADYNPFLAATLGPNQPNPNLNLGSVGLTPGTCGGLDGPDRIFVGGLPDYFIEAQIRELLETFGPLRGLDLVKDRETGNSKGHAFCVYQDLAVTDIVCEALNGIKMGDKTLTVRRANQDADPQQPNPNLNLGDVGLTLGSASGLDGPDWIFVGGLPDYFTETQIRELLESFGPLRGFDLVKDREIGNSKGHAFCVYQDLAVTDIVCAALNGIKVGDETLTVRLANQDANPQQPEPEQESILMHAQPALVATKVVCLTHAVSADELKDDENYEDILDDMRQECSKFGTLVNVVIPRPPSDGELMPGVGKVFLEYVDVGGATKARAGLNGRKFGGNQVIAVFYPENKFAQGDYEG